MDAIANMPSSAISPAGISLDLARQYIRKFAALPKVAYLHLPEGAPESESQRLIVGKTLAFLVSDFLAVRNKHGY